MTRGQSWRCEEVQTLIDIWSEVNPLLVATHKNTAVFELFSQKMAARGFHRSAHQCRIKVKKLRQQYAKVRVSLRNGGNLVEERERFVWFDDLQGFLGTRPTSSPDPFAESFGQEVSGTSAEPGEAFQRSNGQEMDKSGDAHYVDLYLEEDEDSASSWSPEPRPEPNTLRQAVPDAQGGARQRLSACLDAIMESYAQQRRRMDEAEQRRHGEERAAFDSFLRLHREAEERRFRAMQERQKANSQLFLHMMGSFAKALLPESNAALAQWMPTSPTVSPCAWPPHDPPAAAAAAAKASPPHNAPSPQGTSARPVAPMMAEVSVDAVTLDLLRDARETVRSSPLGVINTPMIPWCQTTLPLDVSCNIHIKLENMQRTGSFKIRGVANQFARRPKGGHFVTMSAGNYGKSFAYASKHYGSKGKVVMPETAPVSRSLLIQSFGVEVERVPTSGLMEVVNRCVQEDNMTFLHSYDDLDLIAGHASLGMELLEALPEPDVVVVCCGGGGLLAGVAAAIKLSGCDKTRIYGVEPEGACTMYKSFIEKKPMGMDTKSVASGLAPPFAGKLPYELCRRYVEEIVLVSDEEIEAAVSTLYKSGLVVEPSGSAAFAAVVNNKVPKLEGKNVVCILSGGNIGKDELAYFPD